MHLTPSDLSTCCANICQRVSYGEERRNISMARSTLGPFPDEWLLSGLDKILYFCGIKNMCELVDKFPINSDFYLSSSNSESETCVTLSENDFLKECEDKTAACCVKECEHKKIKKGTECPKSKPVSCSVVEKKSAKALKQCHSEILQVSCSLPNKVKKGSCMIAMSCGTPKSNSQCESNRRAKKSICDKKISNNQPCLPSKCGAKGSQKFSQTCKLETTCCDSVLPSLGPGAMETIKKAYCDQLGKMSTKSQPCGGQTTVKSTPVAALSCLQSIKLPRIIGTKWAMARINIFSDCSRTYEILEIRGRFPQAVIPCKTVVFFAVLPDGSTICYDYVKTSKRTKERC